MLPRAVVNAKTTTAARNHGPTLHAPSPDNESRGRILFADDDPMVLRSTTSALLAAGFDVDTVTTGAQALAALDAEATEALLLDIEMPGNQNLELLHALSREKPLLPIVLLTGHPSLDTAVRAVRFGVVDYIAKPPRMDDLIERLDLAVHRGRVLRSIAAAESFATELTRRLDALKQVICQWPGSGVITPSSLGGAADPLRNLSEGDLKRLSRRERDVLSELAKGHSPQRMAETLKLSTNTIRNHLKSIFVKLGVKSQVALLAKLASPRR